MGDERRGWGGGTVGGGRGEAKGGRQTLKSLKLDGSTFNLHLPLF